MAPCHFQIGGFTPLTTIDFPGRLAAVVFCQGCPWRCGYCQNAELIPRDADHPIAWQDILSFLERRRGLLDGVVFSGGEPTLQRGLADAVEAVRKLGFEVGLHTAGSYPERLATLLPHLDWVGLDIKASLADYDHLTGVPGSGARAWQSLEILLTSGVDYEIRTTAHPHLLDRSRLANLAHTLSARGVTRYVAQTCVASRCLNPVLRSSGLANPVTSTLTAELAELFPEFSVRAA